MPKKAKAESKRKEPETLDELLASVQRKYGVRALAKAGDVEDLYRVTHLPSGIAQVDEILGGGFPRGHISELYGPFSSGKTFLSLHTIAETQRQGGIAALVDTEVSFSPNFARALGVDMDKLLISTPESGEEALDIVISLIKKDVDLVILDSATSLATKEELSEQVEIAGYAPTVRLWNAGLVRIKPALAFRPTAFLFTNQVRANMHAMGPYSVQTIEPLGWRSKHDAVLRLEIRRREFIKKGDQKVGQVTLVRVSKSKIDGAVPFSETTFDINFVDLTEKTKDNGEVLIQEAP